MPGMGKTFLLNQIQKHLVDSKGENKSDLHYVSSDEIRGCKMEAYLKKNPEKSKSDAHEKTRKQTNDVFYAEIKEKMEKALQSRDKG